MAKYLLDTNIISDLIKQPHGSVMNQIENIGETNIATSIIVACELQFGAEKKGSDALKERIALILSRINILPLEPQIDQIYGKIRADLERKGTPIGANELLIAAHTKYLDQSDDWILVTANEKEFNRVDGLSVQNWLSADRR